MYDVQLAKVNKAIFSDVQCHVYVWCTYQLVPLLNIWEMAMEPQNNIGRGRHKLITPLVYSLDFLEWKRQ